MTKYNIHQQVYILSQASNLLTSCTGSQSELEKKISAALQPTIDSMAIGDWNVVWGPSVWKPRPKDTLFGPSHTWYITHNPSADFGDGSYDTYVVAVAGSANHSIIDLFEDFSVTKVVDFAAWSKTAFADKPQPAKTIDDASFAYISEGTAHGVHILLNAEGPNGTTLAHFLSTIPSSSRIIFTGHSLGGALTPTLALAVTEAGIVKGPSTNVFTYPTAGPSPGNIAFATRYATAFPAIPQSAPATSYQVWNVNMRNRYDIAPHAWSMRIALKPNLLGIPLIFGCLPVKLYKQVTAAIALPMAWSLLSRITYAPLQGVELTPEKPTSPKTFKQFMQIARTQHNNAYSKLLGTPKVPPLSGTLDAADAATSVPLVQIMQSTLLLVGEGDEEEVDEV